MAVSVDARSKARLVEQFADGVACQTDAIKRGDHKAGNRHAKRYIKAFAELQSFGDEGREALVQLLASSRDDVRVLAASFLLRYRTIQAIEVLEEAAKGRGIVAFGAAEALKRWHEGTWNLDVG